MGSSCRPIRTEHEDLFIPEGENGGAITGDIVRAKITNREQRDGKAMYRGRIIEIITRSQKRFVGTLVKQHARMACSAGWQHADRADPHARCGVAAYQAGHQGRRGIDDVSRRRSGAAQGVITRVLGQPGEKDVDLQAIIVQFNLPEEFPEECLDQARQAVDRFQRGTQSGRAGWICQTG